MADSMIFSTLLSLLLSNCILIRGAHMHNLTKVVGQEATFSCEFDDLASDKGIAWIHVQYVDRFGAEAAQAVVLTSDVLQKSSRLSVAQESQRESKLRIRNIQEEDAGKYICKTSSQKSRSAFLRVHVPAKIVDYGTSSGVTVPEYASARLTCMASGVPTPVITWRREDNRTITIDDNTSASEYVGQELVLRHADRYDMGNYLCLANNSVPPTSMKMISLDVTFPPTLKVASDSVTIGEGRNVTLPCRVEASPQALIVWTKENGLIQNKSGKYLIKEEYLDRYKTTALVSLTILNLEEEDFQTYRCEARNLSGESNGTIRLNRDPSDTRARKKANATKGRSTTRNDVEVSKIGRNGGTRMPSSAMGSGNVENGGTVIAYVNNPSGSLSNSALAVSKSCLLLLFGCILSTRWTF